MYIIEINKIISEVRWWVDVLNTCKNMVTMSEVAFPFPIQY